MSNQVRVKIVSKPLNNTKYHLATFNQKVSRDCSLPKHILEEVSKKDLQKQELSEQVKADAINPINSRKTQKLQYMFEEVVDNREPQKFYGYQDETFAADGGSNANYAIMIYDAEKNVFKIVPVEKHFKFEKKVEIKMKKAKPQEVVEEQVEPTNARRKAAIPKASKINSKRQMINKIFNDQRKQLLASRPTQVRQRRPEEGEEVKPVKKKKKGLTEKDLDYEEMFDDDQEEDNIAEDDDQDEDEDDKLSEDGRLMKQILKEQEEEKQNPTDQRALNLNFEIERGEEPDDKPDGQSELGKKDADEDGDGGEDSDSSMASIFGDEDGDNDAEVEVGTKRGSQGNAIGDSGEKKRQRLQ